MMKIKQKTYQTRTLYIDLDELFKLEGIKPFYPTKVLHEYFPSNNNITGYENRIYIEGEKEELKDE